MNDKKIMMDLYKNNKQSKKLWLRSVLGFRVFVPIDYSLTKCNVVHVGI